MSFTLKIQVKRLAEPWVLFKSNCKFHFWSLLQQHFSCQAKSPSHSPSTPAPNTLLIRLLRKVPPILSFWALTRMTASLAPEEAPATSTGVQISTSSPCQGDLVSPLTPRAERGFQVHVLSKIRMKAAEGSPKKRGADADSLQALGYVTRHLELPRSRRRFSCFSPRCSAGARRARRSRSASAKQGQAGSARPRAGLRDRAGAGTPRPGGRVRPLGFPRPTLHHPGRSTFLSRSHQALLLPLESSSRFFSSARRSITPKVGEAPRRSLTGGAQSFLRPPAPGIA